MITNQYKMQKFFKLLKGKEGCNFTEMVKEKPEILGWKCGEKE